MIVVAGMHRSGTSCVTELLEALGLSLAIGEGLLEGDEWNARGYFEEQAVLNLNSRLVTGHPWRRTGPRRWLSLAAYASLPSGETIRRRAARLGHEIERLSAERAGLVVKDPRFCLTLEAWSEYGSVDACVVCLRHPQEIVLSLARRQRVPMALGYRFWTYHMRALLDGLPERSVFVNYNDLFGPDAMSALGKLREFFDLKLDDEDLAAAHERVCSPELFHCQAERKSELPAPVRALWDELRGRAAG